MFYLSNSSNKRIEGVRSPVRLLIERSLSKSPHDFGIPGDGGVRTAVRQNELYQIGRTTELEREEVTWLDGYKKKSIHQFGMAFDIYVYDEHGACWDCKEKYKEIAEVIKAEFKLMQRGGHFCSCEKLTWGGDWDKPDLPHFQVTKR